MERHIFETIPLAWRGKLFWLFLAATLFVMIVLNQVNVPLKTAAAPAGIVSFELAGSPTNAQIILDSWDQQAQMYAAFSLGFDYLFLVLYSATIGLACVWSADILRRHRFPPHWLGISLAWGMWLAAGLDAVENFSLYKVLFDTASSPWPEIARWCALPKFGLVLLGIIYGVGGLIFGLLRWLFRRSQEE